LDHIDLHDELCSKNFSKAENALYSQNFPPSIVQDIMTAHQLPKAQNQCRTPTLCQIFDSCADFGPKQYANSHFGTFSDLQFAITKY